ncbi:hypothetical protein LCGC14_2169520 [marine sediment metagenome]|uniref:Uncharacterized protein n=1 Tax=marine sediment metagenome TaxID=412755 RepID=A0A0F9DQL2_9ZZZZ
MRKSYVLLKDLPDVKAGAIFKLGAVMDAYYLTADKTGTRCNCYMYPKEFVENSPDWFRCKKESEPKDTKEDDLTKRKGKFFLDHFVKTKRPDLLKVIFSNFYPINSDCGCNTGKDGVMFYGYSPHFRTIDKKEIPEYVLVTNNPENKDPEFDSFEEVENFRIKLSDEDIRIKALNDELNSMLRQGKIELSAYLKIRNIID